MGGVKRKFKGGGGQRKESLKNIRQIALENEKNYASIFCVR